MSKTGTASSLFRSEEMTNFKLYIPMEISQFVLAELGELSVIEFTDVFFLIFLVFSIKLKTIFKRNL